MNAVVPLQPRLDVEVVYDLVCPWCYLGTRRLLRALRRRSGIAVKVHWRPFLLNPDMPREGMTRADYASRKYGGEERMRRLNNSVAELARQEGLVLRFDRIARMPSSVDAHRLVAWAMRQGEGEAMVETLFAAHFIDGHDVGCIDTLVRLAALAGLDGQDARRALAGREGADMVHGENLRAHRLGINGVPCFVFNGRFAISGAQEPDVLDRVIDAACVDLAPSFVLS